MKTTMTTYHFKPNKDYLLCKLEEEGFTFSTTGKVANIYRIVNTSEDDADLKDKLIIPEPEYSPVGFNLNNDVLYIIHKDWIRVFIEKTK